jgi:hypothetical protein
MSLIVDSPSVTPPKYRLRRAMAVAGFALVSGALPLAVLAAPSEGPSNLADCAIGWVWDPVTFTCVPYVNPVVGPVGPVGVGGVVGPVGVDPVVGPVGPVGVGGVVGPVGVNPVIGPVGPVGVGPR